MSRFCLLLLLFVCVCVCVSGQEGGAEANTQNSPIQSITPAHTPVSIPVNPSDHYSIRFVAAFVASISMIIVSEFGDKTFFIAAIMAMRNSRTEVFLSAISALALMTVLSAVMGLTLPNVLPPALTHMAATLLFCAFGIKLIYDAYHMDPSADMKEELEEELEHAELAADVAPDAMELGELNNSSSNNGAPVSPKSGVGQRSMAKLASKFFSPVFIQCFTMTFLAEWGDRSQIATIALAAQKDAYGVTIGGIVGHALCTGVAVIGGKLLATRISERTIAFTGGALFLIFALHSFVFGE